jgi:hypothetical protein
MKWVIPTSVRKWYSFGGVSAGPRSGAHGIQFSTKGYKNFLVLTDTWGRQEQWIHALEDAIETLQSSSHVQSRANALAIEIDNDADNSSIISSSSEAMRNTSDELLSSQKDTLRSRAQTLTNSPKERDFKLFQPTMMNQVSK